jgi:hypothetical protein
MLTAQTLRVTCHEKGRPDRFEADVAADCTGAEVVRGLIEAGYLTGPTSDDAFVVTNARTGTVVAPNASLEASEVRDGEVLTIMKDHFGA